MGPSSLAASLHLDFVHARLHRHTCSGLQCHRWSERRPFAFTGLKMASILRHPPNPSKKQRHTETSKENTRGVKALTNLAIQINNTKGLDSSRGEVARWKLSYKRQL